MRKPNLFVVGMPRSGTTSLYGYLKQHPEIYTSVLKEPNFFCHEYFDHPSVVDNIQLYEQIFDQAGDAKYFGEGSVWYLYFRSAAKKLKEYNAQSKSIILLRHPTEMIISLHSLYLRTGNESVANLEEALQLESKRRKNECLPASCYFPSGLNYTSIGSYYEKLEFYLDLFPRENIHVVLFDNLISDTKEELKKIFAFLDVRQDVTIETDPKNVTRVLRDKVITQLRTAPKEISQKMRYKMGHHHMGNKKGIVSDAVRDYMDHYFIDDLQKTEKLLGLPSKLLCRKSS
ncbi:MAG: sulfotransferase [Cytophagales bacterium]|nr:sulfotransferase [Cytophagales bacterium]